MGLQPSSRLGAYEILGPLGAGGMGEVYRARDSKLEREVAVKVLPERLAGDADSLARFEREAKAVAALSHPNILAIHDFGTEAGAAYAVMELLEGEVLRERLAAGALPPRKAVEWALQIANGLAAAHERGIVHRDLKPENVFLTRDGQVKILDFGLARHRVTRPGETPDSPTRTRHTEPGTVLGTAGYMSPEQVRGLDADHRSDIFSFGALLFEMLTGRRAFRGESAVETMNAILTKEPDLPQGETNLTPELERLVLHCLEKRPEDRFQSARDLAFDLGSVGGASGRSAARAELKGERVRPRTTPLLALGLAAMALGFAAGRWFERSGRDSGISSMPEAFTQVTDQPGVETQPSLSPDGKTVAYVSRASGNDDIYLQRVGGGAAINLTADSKDDDRQPAFSPDGERIAFRSTRGGGGVFVMGTTGESVRRVTDFGNDPAWSPDGKEIVVSTVGFEDPLNRTGTGELWAIDLASGGKRPIVTTGDAIQPSWSPHGKRIVYWGLKLKVGGQRDIWTVAADGSESKSGGVPATDDVPLDWSPVWSPDGRFIYFSSDRGGSMNVWRLRIDEDNGRVLSAPEAVTTPAIWAGPLSFSRDGRRLAFATLDWRSTLQKVAFDSAAGTVHGSPQRFVTSTQPIRDHEVSPDGQWVAYTRTIAREDVFVAKMDGTSYRRLTDDVFRDRGPAWSPDGQRIAFYSDRGGKYELWTIRPDGSSLQQITQTQLTLNFPSWSPDGRHLVAPTSRSQGWFVIDPAGKLGANLDGPMPPLDKEHGVSFYPLAWSRDGAFLLGTRLLDASGAVLGLSRYALASRHYDDVYDNQSATWLHPICLSDGRRALVRDRDGIFVLDLQTKKAHRLLDVQGQFVGRSVGVTKDERFITFTETAADGNIWLLNFRQ